MWPFNPKPKTQLKIQVVGKPATKLRLDELRSDPEMAKAADQILSNPMFEIMMQVAKNESPALIAFREDISLDARALHQSKIEGYNMALRNFQAMGEPTITPEQLSATFEPEEKQ